MATQHFCQFLKKRNSKLALKTGNGDILLLENSSGNKPKSSSSAVHRRNGPGPKTSSVRHHRTSGGRCKHWMIPDYCAYCTGIAGPETEEERRFSIQL